MCADLTTGPIWLVHTYSYHVDGDVHERAEWINTRIIKLDSEYDVLMGWGWCDLSCVLTP